jgi:hypothetical protein
MPAPSLLHKVAVTVSSVSYPGVAEAIERALVLSGLHTAGSSDRLSLLGSGTKVIDFATTPVAGAKAILVYHEQGTVPFELDVGTDLIEISPGGLFLVTNPTPVSGITALSIVHTADSVAWVRVFA